VVIFDPNYGDRLIELAKVAHVWATASKQNKVAAERYMTELRGRVPGDEEKKLSLTLTHSEALDSRFLETLEDHHGEYAQDPPWTELQVIGKSLDPKTRKLLEDWGFRSFVKTIDGFVAKKEK
jgi:hypothetical protein